MGCHAVNSCNSMIADTLIYLCLTAVAVVIFLFLKIFLGKQSTVSLHHIEDSVATWLVIILVLLSVVGLIWEILK